jgi:cell filamentation protein
MKKDGRYKATGREAEYETGSGGEVPKNLLGIKTQKELDRVESVALKQAEDRFQNLVHKDKHFTAKNICNMHKMWLGSIYEWAGKYRSVDLEKKDIRFAHAKHIPTLMDDFERNCLAKHTPCTFDSKERVIQALAEVHVELVLIHPFREGNGRLARALAVLMALQAGFPPLDFTPIERGKEKLGYFRAVQAGIAKNYEPMKNIFREIIEKGLSRSREK